MGIDEISDSVRKRFQSGTGENLKDIVEADEARY